MPDDRVPNNDANGRTASNVMTAATHTAPSSRPGVEQGRSLGVGQAGGFWDLLRTTVREWSEDKVPRLGAALAFYSVLSIAPLLLIAIADRRPGLRRGGGQRPARRPDPRAGRHRGGARPSRRCSRTPTSRRRGTVAALHRLRDPALRRLGRLRPAPGRHEHHLGGPAQAGPGHPRGTSRTASSPSPWSWAPASCSWSRWSSARRLAAFCDTRGRPGPGPRAGSPGGRTLSSPFVVVTLLFALIFKLLPDVEVAWRDVWVGAVLTTALFLVGKALIGPYLGRSGFGSAYGAAGSLVVCWSGSTTRRRSCSSGPSSPRSTPTATGCESRRPPTPSR